MQKKFSLFCFDEHQRNMSSKPKNKSHKKKVQTKVHPSVTRAVKEAKKRWEFNLIKTGNNQVSWNSGNSMGGRSRAIRPVTGPMMFGAPALTGGTEAAVTNAVVQSREQVVEQDEVVGIMNGSTLFEANTLDVNPGLAIVFPWLSQLAALYERYSFDELVFYYKALGSGFSNANQSGKVIICADYDAAESTPASYRQAETMDPHADGMPFQCIELHLDPRRLNKEPKFIRLGPPPPGTDVKTYDAANVYFCASGTVTTGDIGEIRVRYRVRLMNPRLPGISTQVATNNTAGVWQTANASALLLTTANWTNTPIDVQIANGINATTSGGPPVTRLALLQGNYAISFRSQIINTSGSNLLIHRAFIRENGNSDVNQDISNSGDFTTLANTGAVARHVIEVTRYVIVSGAGSYFDFCVQTNVAAGVTVAYAYVLVRTC